MLAANIFFVVFALVLIVFFALAINPPTRWVHKLDREKKKKSREGT